MYRYKLDRLLATSKPFQTRLISVSKAGASLPSCSRLGKILDSARKSFQGERSSLFSLFISDEGKSFTLSTSGVNPIKLFTAVIYGIS
jgi:hypothetical protein